MRAFWLGIVIVVSSVMSGNVFALSDSRVSAPAQGDVTTSVRVSGAVVMTGVRRKYVKLGGKSIVRFMGSDGFRVLDSSGRQSASGVTSAQMVEALEKLIVQAQAAGGRVDEVQIDLMAVSDLWIDVRSATKAAVKKRVGPIYQKDPEVSAAIRRSIRSSLLVRSVCEMIKKHRLRCDPRDSYVEQVVFSAPGVEVRRNDVLSSDSAGLAPTMAMGLSLVPVDGVVGHK